jgi:hypothetical protein
MIASTVPNNQLSQPTNQPTNQPPQSTARQLFTFSDPHVTACHTAVLATHWLEDDRATALRDGGAPILVQVKM